MNINGIRVFLNKWMLTIVFFSGGVKYLMRRDVGRYICVTRIYRVIASDVFSILRCQFEFVAFSTVNKASREKDRVFVKDAVKSQWLKTPDVKTKHAQGHFEVVLS